MRPSAKRRHYDVKRLQDAKQPGMGAAFWAVVLFVLAILGSVAWGVASSVLSIV